MRLLPLLLTFIAILVVAGCATPSRVNESVDSQLHQQRLSQLNHWRVKGRIAFKSPSDKFSAYMRWQQQDQAFDVTFSTFIGITMMTMQGQPGFTTLEADEQTYTDTDAANLVQRVTGWNIPVDKLSLWVKGQHTDKDNVVYDESGLLGELKVTCRACAPWVLSYSKYKSVNGTMLPHYIELNHTQIPDNQIKIKITSWQLQ